MPISGRDFQTEVIRDFKDEYLKTVLMLDSLFPIKIQDTREKIVENLTTPTNINIFLKKGKSIAGWILGIPQNSAYAELKDEDIEMRPDDGMYYIDKVVVLPEDREGLTFLRLGDALIKEAQERDCHKISAHIVSGNGLHKIIIRKFGKFLITRRNVSLAIHDYLPFEYVEICIPK